MPCPLYFLFRLIGEVPNERVLCGDGTVQPGTSTFNVQKLPPSIALPYYTKQGRTGKY